MSDKSLSKNVAEIFDIIRGYLTARIDLWKLTLLERISLIGSFFISSVILILIAAFGLLFFSFAFAFWYGNNYGDLAAGFLIITIVYVVIGILFYLLRKALIVRPVIRSLSAIILLKMNLKKPKRKMKRNPERDYHSIEEIRFARERLRYQILLYDERMKYSTKDVSQLFSETLKDVSYALRNRIVGYSILRYVIRNRAMARFMLAFWQKWKRR